VTTRRKRKGNGRKEQRASSDVVPQCMQLYRGSLNASCFGRFCQVHGKQKRAAWFWGRASTLVLVRSLLFILGLDADHPIISHRACFGSFPIKQADRPRTAQQKPRPRSPPVAVGTVLERDLALCFFLFPACSSPRRLGWIEWVPRSKIQSSKAEARPPRHAACGDQKQAKHPRRRCCRS
jgi:hypothetical protein